MASVKKGDEEIAYLQTDRIVNFSPSWNYLASLAFPNIPILLISEYSATTFLDIDDKPFVPSSINVPPPPPPVDGEMLYLTSRQSLIYKFKLIEIRYKLTFIILNKIPHPSDMNI